MGQMLGGEATKDIMMTVVKLLAGNLLGGKPEQKKVETKIVEKIVEKQDPKLLQEIQDLKKMVKQSNANLEKARNEALKTSNPEKFKENKEKIFCAFLDNLKHYKLTEKLPKNGKKYHIVIGPISSGKSSLLNQVLGLNLKTGVGETTNQAAVVASNGKVDILDSPGANDDFNFYDVETLALFHSVHRVFILYRTSLKDVKDILRIMKVIKPDETYLVRTQCDNFSETDFKGLDEELETDKLYVEKMIQHKFPIFATSARRGIDFADNKHVSDMIRGADYERK